VEIGESDQVECRAAVWDTMLFVTRTEVMKLGQRAVFSLLHARFVNS
jgi:hypothetical protein